MVSGVEKHSLGCEAGVEQKDVKQFESRGKAVRRGRARLTVLPGGGSCVSPEFPVSLRVPSWVLEGTRARLDG